MLPPRGRVAALGGAQGVRGPGRGAGGGRDARACGGNWSRLRPPRPRRPRLDRARAEHARREPGAHRQESEIGLGRLGFFDGPEVAALAADGAIEDAATLIAYYRLQALTALRGRS